MPGITIKEHLIELEMIQKNNQGIDNYWSNHLRGELIYFLKKCLEAGIINDNDDIEAALIKIKMARGS